MNTSRKENTTLDSFTLVAVVSCVLSVAYLFVTNILA